IVDDDRRLEEADLGRAAVALGDHLAPLGVVDALVGLAALPEITAAAGPALRVKQIIFADETRKIAVFRRRSLEQFGGLGGIDMRRQLETDDGGDHGRSSLFAGVRLACPQRGRLRPTPACWKLAAYCSLQTGLSTPCVSAFSARAPSAAILR